MQNTIIKKAAGIIIKNKKLLVEKSVNKDFFIAPGGTIEEGELAKQALVRELKEEFTIDTKEEDFVEFGVFKAAAAGREGMWVEMQVFIVYKWEGEIKPDSEVEKILWLTSDIPADIKVGSIFEHEVIPRLKAQGLID